MSKFNYRDPKENERDPFASGEDDHSEFEALLAAEGKKELTGRSYKKGETVTGKILRVTDEFVFVDLGGKNSGILALDEIRMSRGTTPKVGDEVSAFVRTDTGSEILLSMSVGRTEADSAELRHAYESRMPIEAKIEKIIKGGFEASIGRKRAFVPLSQMELGTIDNTEGYLGTVHRFIITEFSQGGRNIVLSRKALLQEERKHQADQLLANLQVGQAVKGTISRLAPIGAFVDLGGVDGLIPLSELSWKKVKRPEDVVKVGEMVEVKVIRLETTPRLRIGLSLKDAADSSAMEEYKKQNSRPGREEKTGSGILADAFAKALHDRSK